MANLNQGLKFDSFPLWLRKGPWSPVAHAFIVVVIGSLAYVALVTDYLEPLPGAGPPLLDPMTSALGANVRLVSCCCGLYMAGVLGAMFYTTGAWPMASYTMISWTLLMLRHVTRALAAPVSLQELLRFPAVAGATITVTVWWGVLVPAIYYFLPTPKARNWFVDLNLSPFLINVHALNLPLVMLDHALAPRPFTMTDLWVGFAVGVGYLVFYLLCLDARGVHFYIILSPRTAWCAVSYGTLLGIYCMIWQNWGAFMDATVGFMAHGAA